MNLARRNGTGVIIMTLLLALVMEIMPLPDWAANYRPQWLLLVLIYWCMALPNRVGVGYGWVCGILLDVMTGVLLGQHALGLTIVAYIALKLHQRTRVLPLHQQAFTILLLLLVERLIAIWVAGTAGYSTPTLWYWVSPLIGMMLWPWIYVVLRDIRRRFRIA